MHDLFRRAAALPPLVALLAFVPSPAVAFQLLTRDKVARYRAVGEPGKSTATIRIGADRFLQTLQDPTCPSTSSVQLSAYPSDTLRIETTADVALDCAKWKPTKTGFRYADPTGTVRSIRYSPTGLRIKVKGPDYAPVFSPVVFTQAQLRIGSTSMRVRFHDFRRNDGLTAVSRKPSREGAAGEAGFWDMMFGDADGEPEQQAVIADLTEAVQRNPRDGRSHFLLAMTHMYRFGQRVSDFAEADATARAELAAANAAFAQALPLLWDPVTGQGDSRVPGFAGAAKYSQGAVEGDASLRAEGLAQLEAALAANPFFNIFDYIPVLQSLPPADPLFQEVFTLVTDYLADPDTGGCFFTQPELCANAGFASHNTQGSLTLFGDLFAKAGDLSQAEGWYDLVGIFPETATWPFVAVIQDRNANAAARVALYADADPDNDPPLIGAGAEACAACHRR